MKKFSWLKVIITAVVIGFITIYISSVAYDLVKNSTETLLIKEGTLYLEENVDGYILREEIIVESGKSDREIVKIKNEGDKIRKGAPVFRFKSPNEDELTKKITELNIKIEQAIENDVDIIPSTDIDLLETQVKEKIMLIEGMNKLNDIEILKKEINELILKKAEIIGEMSPSGSYINDLIDERNDNEKKLNKTSDFTVAPMSGEISYRIDGYEEIFNNNNIGFLSQELLESMEIKTGQAVEIRNNAVKVVNNYEAYVAVILDTNEAKEAEKGDKVLLEFSNLEPVEARIVEIEEEDTGVRVIVFRVTDHVGDLLEYRKVNLTVVWWSVTGLKVPNSTIMEKDGKNFVIRNQSGYKEEIIINIKKSNDTHSIIENCDTEKLINYGYSMDEIKDMKTISMYDEIYVS